MSHHLKLKPVMLRIEWLGGPPLYKAECLIYATLKFPWLGTKWTLKKSTGPFSFPPWRIVQLRGNNATSENIAQILCFMAQKGLLLWLDWRQEVYCHSTLRDFFTLFMGIWATPIVFVLTLYPVSYAIALPVMTEKSPLWWTFASDI